MVFDKYCKHMEAITLFSYTDHIQGRKSNFFSRGCTFEGPSFHKRAWPTFVRGRDHKNFHLYPSPTCKVLTTPLAAV